MFPFILVSQLSQTIILLLTASLAPIASTALTAPVRPPPHTALQQNNPNIIMAITNGDKKTVLNHITPTEVAVEIKDPVDPTALEQAKAILDELRAGGPATGVVNSAKLLEIGKRLGDIGKDATTYLVSSEECKAAFDALSDEHRSALVNIHARVKAFAEAQRKTVTDMEMDIPGGKAGHTVSPCKGKQSKVTTFFRSFLNFVYLSQCKISRISGIIFATFLIDNKQRLGAMLQVVDTHCPRPWS